LVRVIVPERIVGNEDDFAIAPIAAWLYELSMGHGAHEAAMKGHRLAQVRIGCCDKAGERNMLSGAAARGHTTQ